ncbi:MAG: MerR family transcriptional regulator [Victivallaceae bacterium]|nr:MerR family transcriptional regulator [Victivallaceae bacterium]
MDNRETYIIADFVKELDVPRTTLKDWLERYERYIDFEIRGHRKIYFDSSLEVLKEIAALRADGKTVSEIMRELAERHPVNADFSDDMPVKTGEQFPPEADLSIEEIVFVIKQQIEKIEQMIIEKLRETATELHEAQLAAMLPVLKRQQEKLERVLHMKFHDVATNAHSTHLDANKLTRQNSRRLLLVIALGFTIVITVVLSSSRIYYQLLSQKENLKNTEQNLEKSIAQNKTLFIEELQKRMIVDKEQRLDLKKLSTIIEGDNKNSRDNIDKLKSELSNQQLAFETMLAKYGKSMLEQQREEIKLMKEGFDKDRRELLDRIVELNTQNQKTRISNENYNKEITELKKTAADLQSKMEILRKQKTEAENALLNYRLEERIRRQNKSPGKK